MPQGELHSDAFLSFFFLVAKPRCTSATDSGATRYWTTEEPSGPWTVPLSKVNATTPPFAIFVSRALNGLAPTGRNSRKKPRKNKECPPTTTGLSCCDAHSAKAWSRSRPRPRSLLFPKV